MKAENFCYWLQSAFELMKAKTFDEEQTELIRRHLAMVFVHEIDPSMGDKEHQGKLSEIHHGDEIDLSDPMIPPSMSQDSSHIQSPSTVEWKPHPWRKDYLIRC